MAQIQRTIFFLCIATVYAASITNVSEDDFSEEIEESDSSSNYATTADKIAGQITEFDPIRFILSEQSESSGFQMGKSLVQALLSMFQIVIQMDLSQEGLENVSRLMARMVTMFAGQYYETFMKFMRMFSGMATAFLESMS